jgi:hypothetical protein
MAQSTSATLFITLSFLALIMVSCTGVSKNSDGSIAYEGKGGASGTVDTKLPENWPADAPKYPNAKITYALVSQVPVESINVGFTTTDSRDVVIAFYKKELPVQGWSITSEQSSGENSILVAQKGNTTFGVSAMNKEQTLVTVAIGGKPHLERPPQS